MAANPPSRDMIDTRRETLTKITRLRRIFRLMRGAPKYDFIGGLQGNPSSWQEWTNYAEEQLGVAFNNGTGSATGNLNMLTTYNNIQSYNDDQVPGEVLGLVSSIESLIKTMNRLYRQNNSPALQPAPAGDTPAAPPDTNAPPAGTNPEDIPDLYPPSQDMKDTRKETRRMIEQLQNIFQAMASGHKYENIDGLKGDPCPWQEWADYAQEQLESLFHYGDTRGSAVRYEEMVMIHATICGYSLVHLIPEEVGGLVSSIDSQISHMGDLYTLNVENYEASPDA